VQPAASVAGIFNWLPRCERPLWTAVTKLPKGPKMPTEEKREAVADLADRINRSTIAIATDFTGLNVNALTELRRQLRERGVEYRVVKNRIAGLAATEAGVEPFKEILEGATGVVFGYGDVVAAAKAVDEYIKQTRANLQIRNGVMDGALVSAAQILTLAALPPRDELIARLLGQMNAPITGLVSVLSGPIRGLAIVLQRRAEQLGAGA
jgi:large subunit ribosomal protein L10